MADDNIKIPSHELEPMILAYALNNVSFFLKIKNHIDTSKQKGKSYFNDEKYQRVFNIICKYFDKYRSFPQCNTLKALVDRLEEDKDMKLYEVGIVERAYKYDLATIDPKYLEDEVLNFIKETKVYEAILASQPDVESRNFGAIVSRIEDAVRINFDKDLGTSILDVEEVFRKINELDKVAKISSGFPQFDGMLDGGFHPKEIYCFAAIPGGFKTGFLGNVALNMFLQGKKVLVYTFETATERLMMRYFANLVNMSKKEILLNEEGMKRKAKSVFAMTEGDLIVKEYNANTICSNDLMANINDLMMYKGFKPDVVIVDYILIMNTNDKKLDRTNSYSYFKNVTEELRNIGKTLYLPIITACQINRQGMDEKGGSKSLTTAKDISESRGIYDTVDVFTTINQTANDRKKNKFFVYFDKNRNERTGATIEYAVDYEHMKLTEKGVITIV